MVLLGRNYKRSSSISGELRSRNSLCSKNEAQSEGLALVQLLCTGVSTQPFF